MLKHIATWVSFTKIVVTWSRLLLVMRGNLPISCLRHCLLGLNFFFLDLSCVLHLISVIFFHRFSRADDMFASMPCCGRCLAVSPNFEIAKNNMAIALTDLGTKVVSLVFVID
jgi:hypothetical protein